MSSPEAGNNGDPSPPSSNAAAGAAGAASAVSSLAARELPSAVNSKKLLDEHLARTGGKVWLCGGKTWAWAIFTDGFASVRSLVSADDALMHD